MSIEKAIADLTVAVNANTEALAALKAAGGSAKPTAASEKPGKEEKKEDKKTDKPKSDLDRAKVNAALTEVKEKKGAPAAKTIIKDVGKSERMADIPEENFQAVYDAAKKAVKEEAEEEGDI